MLHRSFGYVDYAPGSMRSGWGWRGQAVMPSSLVSRNVRVVGRRTSVRLEPVMWQAMADISAREGITIFDFCSRARAARHGSNLTASIRAETTGRKGR